MMYFTPIFQLTHRLTPSLPLQLRPAAAHVQDVSVMVAAAVCLQGVWSFIDYIIGEVVINVWPIWPALRAMVLPRFRLACNGLTAMLDSRSLGVEEGRHALATAVVAVMVALTGTGSIHEGGGSSAGSRETDHDTLVEELTQALVVQPQFLSMIKAGAAWARRHAHVPYMDLIYSEPLSECLHDLIMSGIISFQRCLCPSSPSVVDPTSPKLGQATHAWFGFALEILKAGGLQGAWPPDANTTILKYGLGIPLTVMLQRVVQHIDGVLPLPWADRPRYLECALQAAEWMLSAANPNSCDEEDFAWVWDICRQLAAASPALGGRISLCIT